MFRRNDETQSPDPVHGTVLLAFAAAPHAQRGAAGPVTAIVGARLVDGTGAAAVNDSVILVSGDRITAAGPRARVQVPQGATVVNASGKTVIPGLIDVHCHLNQPADVMRKLLPVALNWGVTTIRMTGNDKPEIMHVYADARRRESSCRRACTRAGQGFNLTGPYPGAPTLKPTTPDEARKGVQAHKALKVDFIKLWMGDKGFTPDVVAAIVDEAKKQNIPIVAHIGNVAQVRQLADLGVTDFMHEARDGMNPEFIAYAKSKGLSFAPTLGQGQSRWYYYEHPEILTMDPKFDGFYARGRAMLNDPARRQEIMGAADFAAAEAALQGQQLSVHQDDVRRRHPHRHRDRLRRRGIADDARRPHDASRSADVRRGGDDAGQRASGGDARRGARARADGKSQLRIDPGRQDRRSRRAERRSDSRHQQHHQNRSRHEGGKMGSITVRPDIYEKHRSLFGEKTVNGRRVNVDELIAQLTRDTKSEFRTLLSARHALQDQVGRRERSYTFLPPDTKVSDADGNTTTVRDIRQGMLDGFFGRKTPHAWRLNPERADSEGHDAAGPRRHRARRSISAWRWARSTPAPRRGCGTGKTPAATTRISCTRRGRTCAICSRINGSASRSCIRRRRRAASRASTRSICRRRSGRRFSIACPGLHLQNRQISLDGEQVPAMIPALVMHAVNNYDTQKKNGSGVYYYVPKIETWQEARLVSSLLKKVEEALGLPRGTLKIKMLNERAEYALQQEAIMWVLRENLIGPNVGRWDYLNSREEMFRHDPAMVIPDPNTVTMTEPSLSYYTMRNALLALLAGGMPIGGMAAQMQNPQAPENDPKALRDIWFDKLRERLTGLFKIDGKLHDTYRQSWVATITPSYVEAGREPLVTDVDDLQAVVDKLKPDEKKRLEDLGLLKDGKISPLELSEADLTPEKLFSEDARKQAAVAAAGADDRGRAALRDVHVDGVHVPAAARQQRRGDFRSAHRPAVHERPRDLRDLLALPVSHRVARRRADGRREILEEGRSRDARAVREAARRAARDGEGAVQEARHRVREDERGARAARS